MRRAVGRLAWVLLACCLLVAPAAARAQGFDLPGLADDAARLAEEIRARNPAGATPAQRAQAEQRAREAERAGNWAAAAAAWRTRIGGAEATAEHWLAYARALLQSRPADPRTALAAAWNALERLPPGAERLPALLAIADALEAERRFPQAIAALAEAARLAPRDAQAMQRLVGLHRAAGLLVREIRTETTAEPGRACIAFTLPLAPRSDWRPGDFVRSDLPGLTVQRDGERLCLSGLPFGTVTRITLRAGLPGEEGVALRADTPVAIAMPDRVPRILFDSRFFLLPRGQAKRVGMAVINLDRLELRLLRVSERNLIGGLRGWEPGQSLDPWQAEDIAETAGRLVWQGTVELPRGPRNEFRRIALPLPAALAAAPPGLHVLWVRAAEGGAARETAQAALPLFVTDLGLTAWRGGDGLAAQVRSFADARPRPGVRVRLMARNNEVLGEAVTDAAGLVRFPAGLLRVRGPLAPVMLFAEAGDDFVSLNLEAAAFDLSDRGATGRPHPQALDAFLYLDRGIYRPGETVQLMALLRDSGGRPADLPVRIRVRRPNGQVFHDSVPPRGEGAAIHLPLALSASAPAGLWRIEALSDPDAPPIGRAEFRVEAFVPERLAVELAGDVGVLVPGTPLRVPLVARFLYGAPAEGLSGQAELRMTPDPDPFPGTAPAAQGWRFGTVDETATPDLLTFEIPETDAQGRTTLTLDLPRAPDTTRPLRAEARIAIGEPGGRESRLTVTTAVRGTSPWVAIRPLFQGGSVDDGAEAAFEAILLSPEGRPLARPLTARLVRERPDWRIVLRDGVPRYAVVWRDEPVDQATLTPTGAAPARFARRLSFGRYRLEVTDGALGIASYRFRSGWAGVESAEVPDRVDVSADRQSYGAGETARIRIVAPFAGRGSLAVLTDRLVELREIEVPAGGTEVAVRVDPAWGPGAYLAATVFRPGEAADGQPARALGLAWVALDPAPRRIEAAIEAPRLVRPATRQEIAVRAAPGAMVTLAAVDEGILRLTRFASPDPVGHFLGRRRLGADIRDDYGRLIAPPEGEAAALRQGGDGDEGGDSITPPQRIVSLFAGPARAGADGIARFALDIPDFMGELRLMAVAWQGERIGAAAQPMTVRDRLVAEALLPRFLAPGDTARLPILLHNLELPGGEVVATVAAEGPLAGGGRVAVTLAPGQRATPALELRAMGAGEGVLRLSVQGPDGFTATREARIAVRSSRPRVSALAATTLAPGQEAVADPGLARFVPGTASARVTWGGPVAYDASALLASFAVFPFACTEQVAAEALALAMAPEAMAGPDRAQRLQQAVSRILDRQRFDGAFGLWSASGEPERWVSAFAAEALIRARAGGAEVPEAALALALRSLAEEAEYGTADRPEDIAAQAYRLHVLALAGRGMPGAARRLFELRDRLPTPLARAQLASALAQAGDPERAEALFDEALRAPERRAWHVDFGSTMRDRLAVAVLLTEAGLLRNRIGPMLAALPGADATPERLSTQEAAWAVAAASALGRDAAPVRVSVDGRALPEGRVVSLPLAAPVRARNEGARPIVQRVAAFGLPAQAEPAARAGLRISRRFLTMDGQNLNLDTLRQGQVFLLVVEARAETGETHRAMIQQGLPAGWEIQSRLPPGEQTGQPFLGELSEAEAFPALDDRFAAAADFTPFRQVLRYAVRVRAVTAGSFELPGAEVVDMYRPGIFARQGVARITVRPAE
ncbi:MAG: alpha-2-macroglobulin [Acetobacteraceae bacterium]|nr:alpha-2-macroglobulin [Acetobacteraceae bacterium]